MTIIINDRNEEKHDNYITAITVSRIDIVIKLIIILLKIMIVMVKILLIMITAAIAQ